MRQRLSAVVITLAVLLSGCKVGPNYSRPPISAPPAYRGPDGAQISSAQSLGDDKWATVFKDPVLQDLIRTALKQNYDIQTNFQLLREVLRLQGCGSRAFRKFFQLTRILPMP